MRSNHSQQGQIILITIIFMAVLLTMSAALLGYTGLQIKSGRVAYGNSQALRLAEAGLDKALYELNRNPNYNGETNTDLSTGTFVVALSSIDPSTKQVTVTGYVPDQNNPRYEVTVKTNVGIDLSTVAFNFGVQVGEAGLQMANNSVVNGSVFSNGNITGSGTIAGDATVAGGGSPMPDQQCTNQVSGLDFNASDRRDAAQKFIPAASGSLSKVSVYLKKSGTPGNISVRIVTHDAANNRPSRTTVGGAGTISSGAVTGSYGWIDAGFSSAPTLTAGTTYWLLLDTSSSNTSYYTWGNDADDSCLNNGTGMVSANWNQSNPVWTANNRDFNFKTFMGGTATKLSGVTVNGTARANTLENCTVNVDAYFQINNGCNVAGTEHFGSPDEAPQPLPISQAQIDEWKDVADSGTIINSSHTVTTSETLGPAVIEGSLTVINGATLTLTGPVWVKGDITLNNGATVRADVSLGNAGSILFADNPANQSGSGLVDISNNVTIVGNNNNNSYVMILTTKSGAAMNVNNNAAGAIFYATSGTIAVANNGGGNQITGYGLSLSNNATVNYQIGLQNANFAHGPGGSWALIPGTYFIVE
jgi:hypothetical protein